MADYYPVLKRAISSLPSSSGEARRAVYEKARQALVRQLQSYDPPLSPADITAQRLQLEESIRRVEAEVAGAAFGIGAQEHVPPTPAPPRPQPAAKAEPQVVAEAAPEPARADVAAPKPPQAPPAAATPPGAEKASTASPKPEQPAAAKPAPGKPAPEKPAAEKPAADKPATAKPAAGKPPEAPAVAGPQAGAEPTAPKPAARKPEAAPARAEPAVAKPAGAAPQKVAPKPAPNRPAAADAPPGEPRIGAGVDALAKTLRQAEALGGASANAVRHARDAIEDTELEPRLPVAEPDKIEPGFAGAAETRPPLAPPPLEAPIEPPVRRRRPVDEARTEAVEPASAPDGDRRKRMVIASVVALLLVAGGAAAYAVSQVGIGPLLGENTTTRGADVAAVGPSDQGGDALEPKIPDRLPQNGEPMPAAPDAKAVTTERVTAVEAEPGTPPPPAAPAEPATPPAAPSTDVAAAEPATQPPAATPPPVETTPPAATPPATDGADTAGSPPPGVDVPPPAVAPPVGTTTTTEPVTPAAPVPDAAVPVVPDTAAPAPAATTPAPAANQPVVLVAQRAILYEEPIPGSDGARVEGQVLWTLVDEPVLPGEAAVPQIRATVEVPDRKIKLVLSIRRNTDQALPASHIAEMRFDLPADFPGRGIDTTPGLILKQTEDARGDPLIGAVAKVSDNLFWLALSGADQDTARNVALLKEREWVDVPIRYLNRRRAILTFEKGTPGGEVFQRALAAWGL